MNDHITTAIGTWERSSRYAFERLPEILILLALPAIMFGLIFIKQKEPMPVSDAVPSSVIEPSAVVSASPAASMVKERDAARLTQELKRLNLTGPWSCIHESSRLFIENKNVKYQTTRDGVVTHVLLNGDCVFTWENNGNGRKYCGMTQYVTMAELAMKTGLFDPQSFMQSETLDVSSTSDLLGACTQNVVNSSVFVIPRSIKWEEGELQEGSGLLNGLPSGIGGLLGQ